ncbi:MAG TPA: tRNA (N6-threonylcarbamoyladenosine(37)-N6)-methyltransferase TrmO, partial [Candidatus Omnitrophica bacterium]|nr:tRNA (N6-threonylcarbamoyladenosine(37)-N6)-methyltransferase TrmO [Candidatus Omnitrophota bacterium]
LLNIEGNVLEVEDVDIVDGTPLLDIKPYVPDFDIRRVEKIGWLRKVINSLPQKKDDGRFY